MSKVDLLRHAARVLQVTQSSWANAVAGCGAAGARSTAFIETATTVLRRTPRMLSSRIWARMRRDRVEPMRSPLLLR